MVSALDCDIVINDLLHDEDDELLYKHLTFSLTVMPNLTIKHANFDMDINKKRNAKRKINKCKKKKKMSLTKSTNA